MELNELMKLRDHHYTHAELEVSDIQRREIAFAYKSDYPAIKGRAYYFQNVEDMREHILRKPTIVAAYASTTYYLDPNMRANSKRGFLGYDLVFDIDMPYTDEFPNRVEWMHEVCYRTSHLIEVLTSDLGFDRDTMKLSFSGSKGFHILIDDEQYRTMPIPERTQLCNYIIGTGLVRGKVKKGKGGWNKKYTRYLETLVSLMTDNKDDNEKILLSMGFAKTNAKKISGLMSDNTKRAAFSQGHLWVFDEKVSKALVDSFYKQESSIFGNGVLDSGVTVDKHRVFRFPGTIHPAYGFVATSLELSDLDDPSLVFDKIKQAGGVDSVEVTLDHDAIEDFEARKHWAAGTYTIPRWLALHLLHQ